MKIAVVIPKYGLVGGAENFVYEVTERLAVREGLDIHVFANQWQRGSAPIQFHKVPSISFLRILRPIIFASIVQKKIGSDHFDLIHSHDRIFRMDILTMHGIPHKTWVKKTKRSRSSLFDRAMVWVEEKGLGGANKPMILPVSNLVKQEILNQYEIPETKLRVIHPGVSCRRFERLERMTCRREIRHQHGIAQEDAVVLFVSMNFELKRLGLVMRGIARLKQLKSMESGSFKVKLLVIGKGKVKKYLALAETLGIGDCVIFGGVTRQIEKYYLASDVFALPSTFDTFGIAVLEAMMGGLPVIITETMGVMDIIQSGEHGFVLGEHPSPEDFCRKLAFLLIRENRERMGRAAVKVARTRTWERVSDEVFEQYERLVY